MKWLVVLHILAVFPTFMNDLDLLYKVIITLFISASLYVYLKREFDFSGILIRDNIEFGWEIAYTENNYYPIEILASTVITQYLIGLHFKTQTQPKKTILICKDALVDDDYRKLMVALKISGLKKSGL